MQHFFTALNVKLNVGNILSLVRISVYSLYSSKLAMPKKHSVTENKRKRSETEKREQLFLMRTCI